MEYFIGVDKGPFEVIKSRFEIMNLENIRGSLVCKDNLRNLVKFTTMFKNEKELKAFLVKKGVLARNLEYFDLLFISLNCEDEEVKKLRIPYQGQLKYLDINNLILIMTDRALKYPFYIDVFLNSYFNIQEGRIRKVVPKEYFELKKYTMVSLRDKVMPEIIKRFVEAEVYTREKKKLIPNYARFLSLANQVFNLDAKLKEFQDDLDLKEKTSKEMGNTQYKLF